MGLVTRMRHACRNRMSRHHINTCDTVLWNGTASRSATRAMRFVIPMGQLRGFIRPPAHAEDTDANIDNKSLRACRSLAHGGKKRHALGTRVCNVGACCFGNFLVTFGYFYRQCWSFCLQYRSLFLPILVILFTISVTCLDNFGHVVYNFGHFSCQCLSRSCHFR